MPVLKTPVVRALQFVRAYVLAYACACVCLLYETLIPMRVCVRACGQVCHTAGLVGYGLVMLDFFKVPL